MRREDVEKPSEWVLETAISALTVDLRPVRRLPSDLVLFTGAMLLFVASSILIALALGPKGFANLTEGQRWLYGGTVLGCGLLLSIAVAPQMIPGARRWVSLPYTVLVPIAAVALCAVMIYPESNSTQFVSRGIPCLRTVLLCAAAGGVTTYYLLRRGYIVTPRQTSVSSALFGAYIGIAVLALHCPIEDWLHVLVWHLGGTVLSALATWAYWKVRFAENRA